MRRLDMRMSVHSGAQFRGHLRSCPSDRFRGGEVQRGGLGDRGGRTGDCPSEPICVFAERDYCYGLGLLRLEIERIHWRSPVWYDGEDWYNVEGVEIRGDGVRLGPRQVLVRGSRLPSTFPRCADED